MSNQSPFSAAARTRANPPCWSFVLCGGQCRTRAHFPLLLEPEPIRLVGRSFCAEANVEPEPIFRCCSNQSQSALLVVRSVRRPMSNQSPFSAAARTRANPPCWSFVLCGGQCRTRAHFPLLLEPEPIRLVG